MSKPGGISIQYSYAGSNGGPMDHALLTATGPTGITAYYEYDAYGRLISESLAEGIGETRYVYDSVGRLTIQNAVGEVALLEPDERGRPRRSGDALGREISYTTDKKGNLTAITGPEGGTVKLEYDHLGNVLRSVSPAGHVLRFSYDYDTNSLKSITDARGHTTHFGVDAQGNLKSVTYPDASAEAFVYDANGNLLSATNRRGQTIAYEYNSVGQVTKKTYPDASVTTYAYDEAGRLTTVTDGSGTIRMQYDNRGFMTYIGYPDGHWFAFQYNNAGQRTRREGDDGFVLNYGYDAAGRLETVSDGDGYVYASYVYDAAGYLARENKGNGTCARYSYDQAGQLLSITHHGPDDAVQAFFNYEYDVNGNRVAETNKDGRTTYTYDALGQLTGVYYPDGGYITYEYDASGNRTRVVRDGVEELYSTNNMNQYVQAGDASCAYDADGNMTSKTDASGTTTYVWNAENQLVGINQSNGDVLVFQYDVFGNRVSAIENGVETRFVQDPDGLTNVDRVLGPGGALKERYIHGLGAVSRVDDGGAPGFLGHDGIGNTRLFTDGAGAVSGEASYTPFGEETLKRANGRLLNAQYAMPLMDTGRSGESWMRLANMK